MGKIIFSLFLTCGLVATTIAIGYIDWKVEQLTKTVEAPLSETCCPYCEQLCREQMAMMKDISDYMRRYP